MSVDIYAEHYQAVPINNPFEVIKPIKENPSFYSTIILDINMPSKTGDQVLRAINDTTRRHVLYT